MSQLKTLTLGAYPLPINEVELSSFIGEWRRILAHSMWRIRQSATDPCPIIAPAWVKTKPYQKVWSAALADRRREQLIIWRERREWLRLIERIYEHGVEPATEFPIHNFPRASGRAV